MNTNEDEMIICEGLVKIYKIADLEVFALQGLDLIVNRGEMMGIVGASGSGKSTLMNILGGLDRPSAGRVWVDNTDLLKMNYADLYRYRRNKVGFVWQQGSRNLIPYLTAVENVILPLTISGTAVGYEQKRAESLLESVSLTERSSHKLSELSGGEQQRVAIAVALANQPALLLADEPTGELDSITAESIFQLLQHLNEQFDLTTLIVSHDQGIARYVDRVVAIRDGKTSSETIRQTPRNRTNQSEDKLHENPVDEIQEEIEFDEVILLDAVGRLQVPREFLEHFGIKGRVRLETTEDGILIRPVQLGKDQEAKIDSEQVMGFYSSQSDGDLSDSGIHRIIHRIFKKGVPKR